MPSRIRFTKQAVAALPIPASGRSVTYDREVPKLAVRISSAGSRTFFVIKRVGASMEWVKLDRFPDMSVEAARKAAQKVIGDFANGINPAERRRQERNEVTIGHAYEQYRELHVVPRGVRSADDIASMWQRFLGPLPDVPAKKHGRKRTKHPAGVDWSRRKLSAIEGPEVRALHAAIGRTHQTMANRVVELLSAVYGRAIGDLGYEGENPATGVAPFEEEKRDRFIKPDELPKFFKALADDTSEDFRDYVLFSLLTGARRTNVLAMRWEEVDLGQATWRIPTTKNDDPLVVALVAEAVEILKKRRPKGEAGDTGFVFSAASKVGYMTPPKKRWRQLLARAGIADLRIHDLRRSLGSWQAITGASLSIIGKALGHKTPSATAIYARLHLDPVRASLNTATSAMLTAAGVKKPGKVTKLPRKGARHA